MAEDDHHISVTVLRARGALLADEVGLGKTIEAGLVISQLWAERKRRVLIVVHPFEIP